MWLNIHTAVGIRLARGPHNVTGKHIIPEYNIDSRRRCVCRYPPVLIPVSLIGINPIISIVPGP
jgi:hypothetical protein